MATWYFLYGSNRLGPMDDAAARAQAAQNPQGFAWREGLADWVPIRSLPELNASLSATPPPAPKVARADEIEYRIVGQEMQFVEVELDPGESAIAEAGAMMYKDPVVVMETVFGDASREARFMDKLLSAGKRLLTGESLFITLFTNKGTGKAKVAFAAPFPGTILPIHLPDVGGQLVCQKDSFLAAARGVSIGIFFQRKILTGLFGGEGFIMEKLEGDGLAFVHAGGTVVERHLAAGESLHVDTGCVVAFEQSVDFDVQTVGGVKSMLFGGEGVFYAHLRGPGRVWLQSLPFSRLAGRMLQAAMPGGRREEGSLLGPLGNILDGDSRY
ncbi:MAG: TIGR00266 family protein [Thermoanaerobaculum sp.]|nr:TIGR00266 family protein [Thermoanaerobaculum sp.]MDW7967076.1 TIGR00266 family protein [Thermoanaerobaculum sp.]